MGQMRATTEIDQLAASVKRDILTTGSGLGSGLGFGLGLVVLVVLELGQLMCPLDHLNLSGMLVLVMLGG